MNITTTYKTNSSGTGQILAKGGGRQRTLTYDPSHTPDWNHGTAAGTLGLVLWQGEAARRIAARVAKRTHIGDGQNIFNFDPI